MRLYFAIWASSLLLAVGLADAQDQLRPKEEPTLEETLSWLRKLDENYDRPRFQTLTTERLKTLSTLTLGGHTRDGGHVRIPADDFRYLLPLKGLRRANLGEIDGLGDDALMYIGKLVSLTHLYLHDGKITDAGLKHLTNLKDLKLLVLGANRDITDAGLRELVKLKNLEDLRISYTQVGDDGLKMLTALPRLKALWMMHTNVTDEGIRHLSDIKTLTHLYINLFDKNKNVTEAALTALKRALPNLQVDSPPQLEPSRDDVALEGSWFYDDLNAAFVQAQRTGQPLLVVFR